MGAAHAICVCQTPEDGRGLSSVDFDDTIPVTDDNGLKGTGKSFEKLLAETAAEESTNCSAVCGEEIDTEKPDGLDSQMAERQDATNSAEVQKGLRRASTRGSVRFSAGNVEDPTGLQAFRDSMYDMDDSEASDREPEDLNFDEQHLLKDNSLMHFISGTARASVATLEDPKMQRARSRTSLLSENGGQRNSMLATVEQKKRSSLLAADSTFNNLDESDYTMGPVLGEGAFGIVFSCSRAGNELAIKLVDKVETSMVDIIKEAKIQYKLSHPNIVKFQDFFDEQFFVCIVMDKYAGGSLIQGMQRSLKGCDYTGLDCDKIVHVTKQLAAPVQYLHLNRIIHRDINGDNYFLDRLDILDLECKVVLGDFGLALEAETGERVQGQVGRKLFWAPEIATTKTCSFPADIWALGVTIFGLLDGRFPFADEQDAAKGSATFRFGVHPAIKDLVHKMLNKEETLRITAEGVTHHPWITRQNLESCKEKQHGKPDSKKKSGKNATLQKKPTFKRGRSDEDVSHRRKLLLHRLLAPTGFFKKNSNDAAEAIKRGRKAFNVTNRSNKSSTKYEWWQPSQVMKANLPEISAPPIDNLDEKWLHTVTHLLKRHAVDIKKVGKGTPLQKLAEEVSKGTSRLMLDATKHQTLVRAVNAVLVCVRTADLDRDGGSPSSPRVLVQKVETTVDGETEATSTLPGIIKEAHENNEGAAWRVMRDLLGFDENHVVMSSASNVQNQFEGEIPETSPFAFPGLQTVCNSSIIEFVLVTNNEQALSGPNWSSTTTWSVQGADGIHRELYWAPAKEAQQTTDLGMEASASVEGIESRMVPAPFGPSLQELKAFVKNRKIDITSSDYRSLEDLYAETRKGVSSLVMGVKGDITHVIDIVMLHLRDRAGRSLVQTEQTVNGVKSKNHCLPSTKRRAGENHFHTAWRLIGEEFMLDTNMIRLDAFDVKLFEEVADSLRIPGMQTVRRTRLIKGRVVVAVDASPTQSPRSPWKP